MEIKFECKDKFLGHIYKECINIDDLNDYISNPLHKNFTYLFKEVY